MILLGGRLTVMLILNLTLALYVKWLSHIPVNKCMWRSYYLFTAYKMVIQMH